MASNFSSLSTDLCTQMPFMTGCSLRNVCVDTPNAPYCSPFSLYASQCSDMVNMTSCSTYKTLCGQIPRNPQCTVSPPLNSLPSTQSTTQMIYSICSQMPSMSGCATCAIPSASSSYANCDLISTYSSLCLQMPYMDQCQAYKSMCAQTPSLSWCSSSSPLASAPEMQMFFHTGIQDYILFQSWVPRSVGQYISACIGLLLLALTYEALQTYVLILEAGWRKDSIRSKQIDLTGSSFGFSAKEVDVGTIRSISHFAGLSNGLSGFRIALSRGGLRFISASLGYLLMLVAMTFNVGLILSVLIGFSLGTVFFAPIGKSLVDNIALNDGDCLH